LVIINSSNLNDSLSAFLALAKDAGCRRLTVAYSGGIDSHVLLHHLHQLHQSEQNDDIFVLDAIYINHNLSTHSEDWGIHCEKVCKSLDVPFKQINVQAKALVGESPEEKARLVRYDAFESEMQSKHWLITAQHQEDQAETLLLQLLRGSGADGLAAMPFKRKLGSGMHYRPLLKISKEQITTYATEHKLQWIEDPSNQDSKIARNYLRHKVMPVLKSRWPETTSMLSRSSDWLAESSAMMKEAAEQDYQLCKSDYQSLNIDTLNQLSLSHKKNLLRYWFHHLGLQRPGIEKLHVILEQIIGAKEDATPCLNWQNSSIRRYQNKLYVTATLPDVDVSWQQSWDLKNMLTMPDNWASIISSEVSSGGLSSELLGKMLTVKVRAGGEHCHPVERSKKRSLKKLFQEYSIPPWLRERWPLLYSGEQLVAVPGLFICKGFEAKSTETGIQLLLEQTVTRKNSNQ
jgi:tRNA(Ile)-lysidine synthase